MKLKDPTPSRTPPGGSPLLDQQPSRDFVGDGGLMPGDQWREAIERALGVDSDPIEHTPDWAYERVLTIREIGNGVRCGSAMNRGDDLECPTTGEVVK